MNKILSTKSFNSDLALLLLRVGFGSLLALTSGWNMIKLYPMDDFTSAFWMGPKLSMIMCIFAMFFCSWFLVIGLFSRIASFFLIVTFGVAVFQAHAGEALNKKEHAALYLVAFIVLFITGPGKYSVDRIIFRK